MSGSDDVEERKTSRANLLRAFPLSAFFLFCDTRDNRGPDMIETPPGCVVEVGRSTLRYTGAADSGAHAPISPREIGHLRDATSLWRERDASGLKDVLRTHGYIFIRGLHDRSEVG